MSYVIAISVIGLSAYLFKKASGTLKINLINISSYTFYLLMAFEFVGVTLVYLGFRDHYLIQKITSDNVINVTYWSMAYTMIALPLIMILANRFIFKVKDLKKIYLENISKDVELENEKVQKKMFILVAIALIICIASIIYVFYCIGYVPIIKLFDPNFDFATERINSNRNFNGNVYVKNIIMLLITPLLSYIAYIYMRTTKQKKWIVLFVISFIFSILAKTYDFSKSPVIYYLCFFFIIEVLLGKTFKLRKIIPFIMIAILIVILFYVTVMGYEGNFFSLSTGPMARIIMGQASTLFLHFQTFPDQIDFLNGHSFPPFTKILFGEGEYDVRSGRSVMELYNPTAVENGTAGVMSTAFIGEAYANFGYTGLIIAPIIVGLIISAILCIYLKSKKTPLNIVLYLECLIIFTTVLNAGFIEFFYNVSFFIVLIVIWGFKVLSCENLIETTKNKLNTLKEKFSKA